MTNLYHATPYDVSATGFYFKDLEEYVAKAATHTNEYGDLVEEYEIQFIDGDHPAMFNALNVCQASLKRWFDDFEQLEYDKAVKVIYLLDHLGYDTDDVLDKLDVVHLHEGSPQDYTEQFVEDTGLLEQMPENLRYYFDMEAYTRDLLLGGDIAEVEIMGKRYIAQVI